MAVVRRGAVARKILAFSIAAVAVAAAALPATAAANHSVQDQVSKGQIGGNGAFHAGYRGTSTDGSTVFFTTDERLSTDDTDGVNDVYRRSGGLTTLISIGPDGGNGAIPADFDGTSADGTRVFFHTRESLLTTDSDATLDLYERSGATTTIKSQGNAGGNAAQDVFYTGSSTTGDRVFFVSYEKLTSDDGDSNRRDVYQHSSMSPGLGGTTTLLSTSSLAGGAFGADYSGASSDGTHVFFATDEALTTEDTDGSVRDIYERVGSTTTLVSTGPAGGGAALEAFFGGTTPDGARVWFQTSEKLVAGDTDGPPGNGCPDANNNPTEPCSDVYERSGGTTTTLVSTSSTSPNGAYKADFTGASQDGTRVFFTTDEPLVSSDTDNGCPDQVGNLVNKCIDVYERTASTTNFVSTSSTNPQSAKNASFATASQDGSRVFFSTQEKLVPADTDNATDIYERTGGTTSQVSTGPTGGNGTSSSGFLAASADGTRVFFQTFEALNSFDTDSGWIDIYERFAGSTTLISTGPASPNIAQNAEFAGNTSDGTRVFFNTLEPLLASDTDTYQDVYSAFGSASSFPRPASATPLRVPFVLAYNSCVAPNSTHTPPLNLPACTPPVRSSTELTMGIAKSSGFAKIRVLPGNLATPEDEADISISIFASDVRRASDGLDYTGQLIQTSAMRLTDQANGTTQEGIGTIQDFEFSAPVDCVATPQPDPQIPNTRGSNCSTDTTVDALVPGAAKEGKRMVMSLQSIELLDLGPDGIMTPPPPGLGCPPRCGSGDEKPFMVEGVFTP